MEYYKIWLPFADCWSKPVSLNNSHWSWKSIGFEGKPEDFSPGQPESEPNNGAKQGKLDVMLFSEEVTASWMTLSFAGMKTNPPTGKNFPPLRVSVKTGNVIKYNRYFKYTAIEC